MSSMPKGYDAATKQMDFSLALREMKKGNKVRRADWLNGCWICIEDDAFVTMYGDPYQPTTEGILATDWEDVL